MPLANMGAEALTDRVFRMLGNTGGELTRKQLPRTVISESTFRMLDDQLVSNGGVNKAEFAKAVLGAGDVAGDKLNKTLTKGEERHWFKKLFTSTHVSDLLKNLEAIFKVKPPAA